MGIVLRHYIFCNEKMLYHYTFYNEKMFDVTFFTAKVKMNAIYNRKSLFYKILKRSIITAKGIKDHFCTETEADDESIEISISHQFAVCVAEV